MLRIAECDAFHSQKSPLHLSAALIAPQVSVGTDGSVAGDDDGKRIFRKRCPHCACRPRMTHMPGYEAVRADPAARYGMLGSQDFLLKDRTVFQADFMQCKTDVFPFQKGPDPAGQNIGRFA